MIPTPARLLLTAVVFSLTAATAGCGVLGDEEQKRLSAVFDRTVGLYEASDVRILGVQVGEVTEITPEGDSVRVEMVYDAKYKIPADAQAVIVAPSVVSDRYVQLTPVYRGGEVLADGVVLSDERTAVPVELDQIFDSFNQLNLALGPQGANKDGALSDLLSVSAENLEGNGELLGTTLEDFSQGLTALSDSRGELFGTVANLADFTNTIATRDATVREFNADLADVAAQLEGEREDLAAAVQSLAVALGEVAAFVRANKEDLTANVSDLAEATQFLTDKQNSLEEFLTVSATALSNLQLAYNPDSGTLDTRDNNVATAEGNPGLILCEILLSAGADPQECEALTEQLTGLLPLPGHGGGGGEGVARGLRVPAPPGGGSAPATRDMTLGGILDGGR
jgi:phospholipid/cholesterol/gamma-HCH transport system substrate-binding protein